MKKILSTTLAIALSIAAVNTVEARRMGTMAGASTKAVMQATQEVSKNPTEENKDAVLEALTTDATPEQLKLTKLQADLSEIENKIAAQRNIIKNAYGWFGFRATEEEKAAYNKAKDALVGLNKDRKDCQANIAATEKAIGKDGKGWSRISKLTVLVVGATAIALAVDQALTGGAYRTTIMTKGSEYATKAGELGRNTVNKTKERLRRTPVIEPVITPEPVIAPVIVKPVRRYNYQQPEYQ